MSFDKGFNFRGTSGFVSDGANTTYVLADTYPTVRNSSTFGWGSAEAAADRSGTDARLAGINFGGSADNFQVDLPSAGTYSIQLALGDAFGGGDAGLTAKIQDNGSVLATISYAGNVSGQFTDATGVAYAAANWPGSETAVTLTFATTTFQLRLSGGTWVVAHLFISQVAAGVTYPELERGIRGLNRGLHGGFH